MKGRPLVTDPNAKSGKAGEPAFIARPPGAPVYHGFAVLEESITDGWRYGAITAFEGVDKEEAGDGFVIAPDGSRAGVVWSTDVPEFEVIMPPDTNRWGVYSVRFPKPVSSKQDLIDNFRAVLPLLKKQYESVRKSTSTSPAAQTRSVAPRLLYLGGALLAVSLLCLGGIWPSVFTFVAIAALPSPILFLVAVARPSFVQNHRFLRYYLIACSCAAGFAWAVELWWLSRIK